jgi:glycosyltransferase involved in cell wall biosynthesis
LDAIEARIERIGDAVERVEHASRWLVQGHAANRERLRALRAQPSYAAAFEDPEPLVSVLIPTYDNTELLLERSLPSVLRQSYRRLEVIVVGHAAAPAVGRAVLALGDTRLRYVNLPYRIVEADPRTSWLTGSVAARNAGYELAGGAWIVDFDDDDSLRPRAIERGLALARERRLEFAYGGYECHLPDGRIETTVSFPPEPGRFATQGAVVHGGLGFFERTPAAGAFGVPNDWFRIEAMLSAGVRFGRHDEIVFDYYPSMRGAVS